MKFKITMSSLRTPQLYLFFSKAASLDADKLLDFSALLVKYFISFFASISMISKIFSMDLFSGSFSNHLVFSFENNLNEKLMSYKPMSKFSQHRPLNYEASIYKFFFFDISNFLLIFEYILINSFF